MTKHTYLVLTFHTTSEAMGMKKRAADLGKAQKRSERLTEPSLQGRLAPIPRQLSAGCGFAWIEPADNGDALRCFIQAQGIEHEALTEVVI